ncbi:hypothetical protein ACEWY4_021124 [Coilia grayii]|uniref:HECT-type E3 ubiquitin transferase n=1 Tax=Coilia grayii TaxID=363190 RepID=A0ABD1J852_9TELE
MNEDSGLVENDRSREKLPPIYTSSSMGFGQGLKKPYPCLSGFTASMNQRRANTLCSRFGTELPPLCTDVRQKQRLSIDTLPQEVKAPFPSDPVIPIRTKTARQFQEDMDRALVSGDWRLVREFYLTTFESFLEINAAFKVNQLTKRGQCPIQHYRGLRDQFQIINTVFDALPQTPSDIQKCVLKGIINSLLREWKGPRTKDDLRAYFILVQNPQYSHTSTYVIYAHLLRQIASLSEADHHFLLHWFKKLSPRRFKQLLERLLQFVSTRLFPATPDDLPPISKCSWWIPSATRVLALLNAANSLSTPPIVAYTDFYNIALDHIDIMAEYRIWQCNGNSSNLVDKVSRRQRVDMNLLFLNIRVRRTQLLADSLDELSRKRAELKKKLRVTFVGEAGLDMGGLTKEWFLLLVRQIFHTDYGMFTYLKDSYCHWFSSWKSDSLSEFQLVGTLMGLAVYNSIALDIHFPPCCYKKLLTPPVVPCDQNTPVGMATLGLDDLQQVMPDLAHGLNELLSYEGNVEEDFYLTFQIFQEEMGVVKSYNLKPGGDKIPVTKLNRKEYVQLYVDFLLNKSIYKQFAAFYYGFHGVCASDALMLLRPEEVEVLVCGSLDLDMAALQKEVQYEGYTRTDTTIRCFWEVVLAFPLELQRRLLHFATGSDRVPVGGMAHLNFKISKIDVSTDWLPISHTCFNQICLPPYKGRKELKHKLTIAISNAEGFGLE